jgi:hypothetical protein
VPLVSDTTDVLYGRHSLRASSPDLDQYLADVDAASAVAGSSIMTADAIVKMENINSMEGEKSHASDTQDVSDNSQDSDDHDETDQNETMQLDE